MPSEKCLAETPSATQRPCLVGTSSPHSVTLGLCAHSWVLYEEPAFRGQKLVLPEGDVELGALGPAWSTQGIGSLRRVVRVSGWVWGTRFCPSTLSPRP